MRRGHCACGRSRHPAGLLLPTQGKFSVRGQTKTSGNLSSKTTLLEIIGYQSDAAHGAEGIIYSNPYLFGRSFSVVGVNAPYMNKSIRLNEVTNSLLTKTTYFIVGIMDKVQWVSMLYFRTCNFD